MSRSLQWIGFLATLTIALILPFYALTETNRQKDALQDYYTQAVLATTDLYAQNCAVCHGAAGEGIGDNPPLNSDTVRQMSESDLARTIARGRYGTLMAGWAMEEGGIFTNAQIDDFVTFIQQANWDEVARRVAELGLTPPAVIQLEVSDEIIKTLATLPDGDVLAQGLTVYAENCTACHGSGAGTLIAPPLDSADLRAHPAEELERIIRNGVPGTLMTAWEGQLSDQEIAAVLTLLYRWPEVMASGIAFPEAEMNDFPSTPQMIAEGQQLFNIACKACHGVDGYGTPMAPALNNQLFLTETPDAAIYQIIAGGVSGTLMPAWGSRLSDYELQTLVAYLRSLEQSAPPILPPIQQP